MRILVLGILISACTSSSTGITASEITCDTTLTYANFGQAFLESNCLDCHAGKESPNLSAQAAVQTNANRIISEAVYSTAMPEDKDLANDERILLGQWLQCGAP